MSAQRQKLTRSLPMIALSRSKYLDQVRLVTRLAAHVAGAKWAAVKLIGDDEMLYWKDAQALGRIADVLESLEGRRAFYLEKGYSFSVLVGEVQTAFGNAALELTPLHAYGSQRCDEAFSLLGPLNRFRIGPSVIGLGAAHLVIEDSEVARLHALRLSGLSSREMRDQVYALESSLQTLPCVDKPEPAPLLQAPSESTKNDSGRTVESRTAYVYLALTKDQISLDAFIPPNGRLVVQAVQCTHPLFLLLELAAESMPELIPNLIAHEREHAAVIGTEHPLLGNSMAELFGDDLGARWAFGQRECGICASSFMKDADLVRIITWIGDQAGWPVVANSWPDKALNTTVLSTYRMETRWTEPG